MKRTQWAWGIELSGARVVDIYKTRAGARYGVKFVWPQMKSRVVRVKLTWEAPAKKARKK